MGIKLSQLAAGYFEKFSDPSARAFGLRAEPLPSFAKATEGSLRLHPRSGLGVFGEGNKTDRMRNGQERWDELFSTRCSIVDRRTAHIATPARLLLPSVRAGQKMPSPYPCCHSSKSKIVLHRFERLANLGW